MRTFFLIMVMALLAACGGAAGGDGDTALAIRVQKASAFDPSAEHGRIVRYRVTVTGEGISPAIIAEFPGDASEGVVEGVPAGEGRMVRVQAINPNEFTILAGEAQGVEVGGGVNDVPVELEAVPIFTNLRSGNAVENTRLVFRLFSDPAHPVIVEERTKTQATLLPDASLGSAEILLDRSTGLGRCAPVLLSPGSHRFSVRDAVTGRATEVAVELTDGTRQQPAPLVPASAGGAELFF